MLQVTGHDARLQGSCKTNSEVDSYTQQQFNLPPPSNQDEKLTKHVVADRVGESDSVLS